MGLAPKYLLKIPRKKEKLTRLSTYDYEQEEAIYQQCQTFGFNDLEDFVKVLIDTGCRAEELIKLAPKDMMKSKMVGLAMFIEVRQTQLLQLVLLLELKKYL